jgi:hypothetical protein
VLCRQLPLAAMHPELHCARIAMPNLQWLPEWNSITTRSYPLGLSAASAKGYAVPESFVAPPSFTFATIIYLVFGCTLQHFNCLWVAMQEPQVEHICHDFSVPVSGPRPIIAVTLLL